METFQIYTVGNGEILFTTFNAIASLLKPGGTLTGYLVTIGTLVGASAAVWYTVFRNQLQPMISWYVGYNLIMLILISPVSNVQIKDTMSKHTYVVANVPFGLAFSAGTISSISYGITDAIQNAFQSAPGYQGGAGFVNLPPESLSYTKTGMIFGAIAMQQSKAIQFTNDDINENMKEFVGQCVTYDAMLGRKYTLHDLKNSENIWGLISEKASKMRSFPWRNVTRGEKNKFVSSNGTEIITCKVGVTRFNALMNQAMTSALSEVEGKIMNAMGMRKKQDAQESLGFTVSSHLPGAIKYLTKSSQNASDLMKQQMMITSMIMGTQAKAAEFGIAPNPEVARAYLQQRSTYVTSGQVVAQTLPALRNTMEAICYAMFIFVMALCLLPNGFKIFGMYAKILLWLKLWSPLFALLNFISTEAMAWAAQSALKGAGGLTIANIVGVNNMMQDVAGAAGYLCCSIPLISWGLLQKGGGYAFSSMASSIMGVSQNAAASASQEAVTGNYNYGNVGLNGFQNENRSLFQQQMAPKYAGAGSIQIEDGSTTMTSTASGEQVLKEDMSNLPVSVRASESQEQVLSNLYGESVSIAESQSKAAEKSQQYTAANYLEIGKQASHMISNGQQFSDQETANVMGEAESHYDKAVTIGKKYGMNEHMMNELSANVNGGIGTSKGIGSIGASISKGEISQANVDLAREELLNLNKSESFRSAQSHMEQYAENKNHDVLDQNTKQAVENFSGSYQNSLQHASRAQKAFDTSKSLSDELRNTRTNSQMIDANYTQDFVNHVGADKLSRMSTREQMEAARAYQANIGNVFEKQMRSKHHMQKEYNDNKIDQSLGSVEVQRARVNDGIRHQMKESGINVDREIRPEGFIMKQTLLPSARGKLESKEETLLDELKKEQVNMSEIVDDHAFHKMGFTQRGASNNAFKRFKQND